MISARPGGSRAPSATSFSIFSSFVLISASAATTASSAARAHHHYAVLIADDDVAGIDRHPAERDGRPIVPGPSL